MTDNEAQSAARNARLRESEERAAMPQHTEPEQMSVEEWLAIRKEAALHIDPKTAEVTWEYGNDFDPYGVYPDPVDEQIGRIYFARAPESDVWVWFGDLPDPIESALWEKHKSRLAFPAGLPRSWFA